MNKAKPVSFKPPLVNALLAQAYTNGLIGWRESIDGLCPKVETRRRMKWQPVGDDIDKLKTPYQQGDLLWVREPWYAGKCADGFKPSELHPGTWLKDNGGLWYQAGPTNPKTPISPKGRYRHGRFMPRWASRITLEVTKTPRVEPLGAMVDASAEREGFPYKMGGVRPMEWFRGIWEGMYGEWDHTEYVWVIDFDVVKVREYEFKND